MKTRYKNSAMLKTKNLLTEQEQKKLYAVHHMHHFKTGKNGCGHDLHHCFLFAQKNMTGDKYAIKHLIANQKLYHILNKSFLGFLYDHLNDSFRIVAAKINEKSYSVFK